MIRNLTNMLIDPISKKILQYILEHPNVSSSEIHKGLDLDTELVTTKRKLSKLRSLNLITYQGRGRATRHIVSAGYKLLVPIDVKDYFTKEINERLINEHFNFDLLNDVLFKSQIFTNEELQQLSNLQSKYIDNISTLSSTLYKKDLDRLGVDLSWKSSQIEGNTYSLLETEQLFKDKIEAKGKQKEETTMLLNHKIALDYILDSPNYFLKLDVKKIIEIHSLLVEGLGVEKNLRKRIIGITGTNYKPLDNEYQISEALLATCNLVNAKDNTFEKAFILLIMLSYIQAFEDGNKRTARIMSNAVLISNNHCPVSFRTIDPLDYKKAMLIFYEQNNISSFKKIFIDQYEFAVNTYFQ